MTNIWKRSLSFLMALIMVFGALPLNTLASETELTVLEQAAEETYAAETGADAETTAQQETEAATEAAAETTAAAEETEASSATESPVETEAVQETETAEETAPSEATEPMEVELSEDLTTDAASEAVSAVAALQEAIDAAVTEGADGYVLEDALILTGNEVLNTPDWFVLGIQNVLTIQDGASLVFGGAMEIMPGAQLQVDGVLVNDGSLRASAGSTCSVAGVLTNNGTLDIGPDGPAVLNVSGQLTVMESMMTVYFGSTANITGTLVNIGNMDVGLQLEPGVAVAADKAAALYIDGTLDNLGYLHILQPTEVCGGEVYVNGTLKVRRDAETGTSGFLELNNTMEVAEGATLYIDGDPSFGALAAENAQILVMGTLHATCDISVGTLIVDGAELAIPQGVSVAVTDQLQILNGASVEVSGQLDLYGNATLDAASDMQLNGAAVLNVVGTLTTEFHDGQAAELTVNDGSTVNVAGILNNNGDLIMNPSADLSQSPALNITDTGRLDNCGGMVVNGSDSAVNIYGTLTTQPNEQGIRGYADIYGQMTVYDEGNLDLNYMDPGKVTLQGNGSLDVLGSVIGSGTVGVTEGATVNGVDTNKQSMHFTCTTVEELEALLETLELYGSLQVAFCGTDTLEGELVIPRNVWLTLQNYGEENTPSQLTIGKSASLTFDGGELLVGDNEAADLCKVIVEGQLFINTKVQNNGIVEVKPDAYFELNGRLENWNQIAVDGEMLASETSVVSNLGSIAANGLLTRLGSWTGNEPTGNVEGPALSQSEFEELLSSSENPELNSKVILETSFVLTKDLNIGRGGRLIVPDGVTLTVGSGNSGSISITDGGKMDVQSGGTLVNNNGITVSDTAYDGYLHVEEGGIYEAGAYGWIRVDAQNGRISDVSGIDKAYQTVDIQFAREADLLYALTLEGYGYISVWSQGMTLGDQLTIPENMFLGIIPAADSAEDEAALTIDEGVALTVEGCLNIGMEDGDSNSAARIVNNGSVVLKGELNVYGEYHGKLPVQMEGSQMYPAPVIASVSIAAEDPLIVNIRDPEPAIIEVSVNLDKNIFPYAIAQNTVTWATSNAKVVALEDIEDLGDGRYSIAIGEVGKTKLTATSTYPGKKIAVLNVEVEPAKTDLLTLTHNMEGQPSENAVDVDIDETGDRSFTITPVAVDAFNCPMPLNGKSLKWASSDTKLATIKANADGSVAVTIKKNQHGVAVISATTTDAAKCTAEMVVTVKEYTPRLASNKLTLNPMTGLGTQVVLQESYYNQITGVEISNGLLADYNDATGILTISTDLEAPRPKNGTISATLTVYTEKFPEDPYTQTLKISVKSIEPAITVKQVGKIDLFRTDGEAVLNVTAKNAEVTAVRMRGTADFALGEDMVIRRTSDNTKPAVKAVLEVDVAGYAYPVTKNITIATSNNKVTLEATPSSSIINMELSKGRTIRFQILDKKTREPLNLDEAKLFTASEGTLNWKGTQAAITFQDDCSGALELTVQMGNWVQPVVLNHKVSVSRKMPDVKLASNTLKLNNVFISQSDETSVILTQNNIEIAGFGENNKFTCEKTNAIEVSYNNAEGKIVANFAGTEAPKAGTYVFTSTPYVFDPYGNKVELKEVSVKVSVAAGEPAVKLGTSSVKLNVALRKLEKARIPVTVTDKTGCGAEILRFKCDEDRLLLDYDPAEGVLYVSLLGDETFKSACQITPVYNQPTSDKVKSYKLTVEAFDQDTLAVTAGAKGKLDAINPDSQIQYTINKITNSLGPVTNVAMAQDTENNLDNHRFVLESNVPQTDAKGKQFFVLKAKSGELYSTKKTYKVQFEYTVCGKTVLSPVLSVKVTQSNMKITAPVVQYYLAQSLTMDVALKIVSPVKAEFSSIVMNPSKTSKELVAALNLTEGTELNMDENGVIHLNVPYDAKLKPGKNYKLVLDIMPVGQTENAKLTQISVTVKVGK